MEKVISNSSVLFSETLQPKLDETVSKYETRRASLLEVLRILMEEKGHITLEEEQKVSQYLGIPEIDVREVMTFYTLFYDKPRARTRFNVCRTLSCHLRGGGGILRYLETKLGIKEGEVSPDGKCSLKTVECLGACELAPMMQINDDEYLGHLTKEKIDEIVRKYIRT